MSKKAYINDCAQLRDSKTGHMIQPLKPLSPPKKEIEKGASNAPSQKPISYQKKKQSLLDDILGDISDKLKEKAVDWLVERISEIPKKISECIKAYERIEKRYDEWEQQQKEKNSQPEKETETLSETSLPEEQIRTVMGFCLTLDLLLQLHKKGEISAEDSLHQLTNQSMLNQVNQTIQTNPDILKNMSFDFTKLFGRELIQNNEYIPIKADEIKKLFRSTGVQQA